LSHDEHNHATDGQRDSLMLSFRGRNGLCPVAFEKSGFHLLDALDPNWRCTIIRGFIESRSRASGGSSLTTRLMCGLPPSAAFNKNANKKLAPFVCMFEQSIPGLAAGYSLKFETEMNEMPNQFRNHKADAGTDAASNLARGTVSRQPKVEQFCAAKSA